MARNNKILIREGTSAPNAADFDVSEPAWDKNNGKLYVKNAAGTMVEIAGGGGGFTGGTLTSNLTLVTGTTSASPLTFQAGTNLTTPTAGAVEYDGRVIYATPAGRGVSPSMMYYRLNSDLAGANVNTAQRIFGVGVTLQADTVYAFQIICTLNKTSGTSSHNFLLAFDGGTATFNNFIAHAFVPILQAVPPTNNQLATAVIFYGVQNSVSELAYINGISGATRTIAISLFGTLSVATTGTFVPRYRLSNAPGGAYSTLAGSHIAIWPIGAAGVNTSVGPWA